MYQNYLSGLLSTTSGAMYRFVPVQPVIEYGVPSSLTFASVLQRPKSETLRWSCSDSSRFEGFRSRCMMGTVQL
jgi:thiamine transporter ThiT